jgi:dTDP-glucose 4,6-dehydratase
MDIRSDKQRIRPPNSEVDRLLADNRLARELLGWEPATSLKDGLKQTIEWVKAHLERYRAGVYMV